MAVYKTLILVLILCISIYNNSTAQKTSGNLAVKREDSTDLFKIAKQLSQADDDTSKVKLLIQQSHLYWYAKTEVNHYLDSSFLAAKTANMLAEKLHFVYGSNEAKFMLCRASVEKNDLLTARFILSKVYGEERIRILLCISEHFLFPLEQRAHFENAFPILTEAINSSKSIGSSKWYYESLLTLSKYYFIKGDLAKGRDAIRQVISS